MRQNPSQLSKRSRSINVLLHGASVIYGSNIGEDRCSLTLLQRVQFLLVASIERYSVLL